MIEINFINLKKYPVSKKLAEAVAIRAGRMEKKISGSIEVVVVNNSEIKKMNNYWRGKNQPTDVLSFAWREEAKVASPCLGQVFISWPKIVSQSKEYGVKPVDEFKRMLAHGLLHLAGHDHKKKSEAEKMLVLQEKILK